jgi:acetyl-CoA carboxylase carboxyl transferase subunit beta
MSWFKRIKSGISTATREKKEVPDGVWHKCKKCEATVTVKESKESFFVCDSCNYHDRIASRDYFDILFDNSDYSLLFTELRARDFLKFNDLKSYKDRIESATKKTGLPEAISVATGKVGDYGLVIAGMDFSFIGGSMGSVVGEKISLAIDHCVEHKLPLMIISKSGGARMMESAFSLMQMAKTSAKLTLMSKHKLPYISFMTDPTTGGVTASFAMLGDINMAEPGALIGFAGPRVIKETIKRDLPEGFQRSEFLLDTGFLDLIVERKNLKSQTAQLLHLLQN